MTQPRANPESLLGNIDMADENWDGIASGAVALALVSICTLPAIQLLATQLRTGKQRKATSSLYEDEDGLANTQSQSAFSDRMPVFFINILSSAGFLVSIASVILKSLKNTNGNSVVEDGLNCGAWLLLLLQAGSIALERRPVQKFNLGIGGALSCLAIGLALLLEIGFSLQRALFTKRYKIHLSLSSIQIVLTICLLFAHLSLPRRPEIFVNRLALDRQYTVSAFRRYSYAWCEPLLNDAVKKRRMNLEDFPRPDHHMRSKDLHDAFPVMRPKQKLWRLIILAHQWAFAKQWMLTLLQSILLFAPQFAMLKILQVLEKRALGLQIKLEAWLWIMALGLSLFAGSWAEGWLNWISYSGIALPMRADLSALIFNKAMRRKDVRGAAKAVKNSKATGVDVSEVEPVSGQKGKTNAKVEEETDNTATKASRQSTINLIAVDSREISEFGAFNYFFPGSLFKLIISLTFLWNLIGWQSLLAGFAVMLLQIPVNIYFSRRYAKAQSHLMKVRDEKTGIITEALQGIRQIKFSALESQWEAKIGKIRSKELSWQWRIFVCDTILLAVWITSPVMLAATSLAVYSVLHGELTPAVAFTSLSVFSQLESTLAILPDLTSALLNAFVSVNRVEKYLEAPEKRANIVPSKIISLEKASVAWPSDEMKEDGDDRYVLRDLNISFPENELSIIFGETGSGKSLLLAAILGEVDILSGTVGVPKPPLESERYDHNATWESWIIPSSIAFVSQMPWIENISIKENILFGLPVVKGRYDQVIEVCALRKDLEQFPDGEDTEIGPNGINLSGGQRWRVTFARALYSRAGILVLDDIFSAVDTHVGRFIFEMGLMGELGQGRTRILVTHHVALCKGQSKYLVELANGTVKCAGLSDELNEDDLSNKGASQGDLDLEEEETAAAAESETSSSAESDKNALPKTKLKVIAKKFVEDEKREQGKVKMAIYAEYLKASGGWIFWTIVLLAFIGQQPITLGRSWWLKLWTASYEGDIRLIHTYGLQFLPLQFTQTLANEKLTYYLGIYIAISLISSATNTLRFFYIYIGSIRGSRVLFEKLTFTVLRTPLRWLDTVPLGRILNRFTADFVVVDFRLAHDVSLWMGCLLQLLGIIVAGTLVSPYIIIFALGILGMGLLYTDRFLVGGREVKRLDSTTKSPILEQFGSALLGLDTIRAFDKADVYIRRMYKSIDDLSTTGWYIQLFNRWMAFRMTMVGSLFAVVVAIMVVALNSIDASLAGFALTFALECSGAITWTIRRYVLTELDMNSAERVIEYTNLEIEHQDGADVPAAWPAEGRLEIKDLVLGYADDLPPVLKGLNLKVEKNQRIGIVGRTGAGKSSLALALFRFLEAREGSIAIDGVNIANIKLHDLRSRMVIIPQHPVLFSGTVRSNLDAYDEHTDEELKDVLQRVNLTPQSSAESTQAPSPANINLFANLSTPITESALNISAGQRQLLCLARALLLRPRIMILDEATSAVDMATDTMIQKSIRNEFTSSTLLVIAHRLSTIADFDRVLVMEEGRSVEFGSPRELMQARGLFWGMCRESGEGEELEKKILGG